MNIFSSQHNWGTGGNQPPVPRARLFLVLGWLRWFRRLLNGFNNMRFRMLFSLFHRRELTVAGVSSNLCQVNHLPSRSQLPRAVSGQIGRVGRLNLGLNAANSLTAGRAVSKGGAA